MTLTQARPHQRMTLDEWNAEGERRFGPNKMDWQFVCPSCGHVQTPEDFRPYKDAGASPDTATHACIGRYDGHMHVNMCSEDSPCNYTGYGLLNLCPVTVIAPDGVEMCCFAFADPEGAETPAPVQFIDYRDSSGRRNTVIGKDLYNVKTGEKTRTAFTIYRWSKKHEGELGYEIQAGFPFYATAEEAQQVMNTYAEQHGWKAIKESPSADTH